MNIRRKEGGGILRAAVGVIQVSPQSPASGIEMPVNQTRLIDGEQRTMLVQMAQASTLQAQSIEWY